MAPRNSPGGVTGSSTLDDLHLHTRPTQMSPHEVTVTFQELANLAPLQEPVIISDKLIS